MSFESISSCKDVEGIHDFGQSMFLNLIDENNQGICRGVSTAWLKAKKNDKDYLQEILHPTEKTGLLHTQKTALKASSFQTNYIKAHTGDSADSPSNETIAELKKAGLGTVGYSKAETYQSFCNSLHIKSAVLTSSCRYFILSIKGNLGGHSVAFHRPWAWIGKNNYCHFFDPNFGKFKLNGETGIQNALGAVATAYNNGLSTGYRLWGFN